MSNRSYSDEEELKDATPLQQKFIVIRQEFDDELKHWAEKMGGMLHTTLQLSTKIQLMANVLQLPRYIDTYNGTSDRGGVYREAYGHMFQTFFEDFIKAEVKMHGMVKEMQELYMDMVGEHEESKAIMRKA